uniref:Uncharacterized protein n=1 Tax=Panagrolaimus sp. PS1159 TaxID=55785 RepID=A0AC35FK10_9BILA
MNIMYPIIMKEKGKFQSWNKSSKVSAFTTLNEDSDNLKKRWNNE